MHSGRISPRAAIETLDGRALVHFMTDRLADHIPSVIVFAIDYLPAAVAPVAAETVLFRRYLDAAGKVVWIGQPPLLWPRDARTLEPVALDKLQWDAPSKLLGVDVSKGTFHPLYRASATHAGEQWGLTGWWLTTWTADPGTVTAVLATDENGRAASWVRRYGGPPGTGFVALYGGTRLGAAISLGLSNRPGSR